MNYLIVGIIGYAISLLINISFKDDLFWAGTQFILLYQDATTSFINFINNLLSQLANNIAFIWFSILLLFFKNKLRIINYLVMVTFSLGMMSLLKLSFSQARPFWYQKANIKNLQWGQCPEQTGNPSGHSYLSIILLSYIANLVIFKNIFFYVAALIISIGIVQSRLGLGVHSINQVLLGFSLGISTLLIYYSKLQQKIHVLILRVYNKSCQFTIFTPVLIQICIISFSLIARFFIAQQIKQQQLKRLSQVCFQKHDINSDAVKDGDLLGVSTLSLSLGFSFATYLLDYKQSRFIQYMLGQYQFNMKRNLKLMGILLGSILVVIAPILLLLLYLKLSIYKYLILSSTLLFVPSIVFKIAQIVHKFLNPLEQNQILQ